MSKNELKNIRILGLEIENIKRIKVVRIKPKSGVVEIAGNNEQGKSSTLDAIVMALEGVEKSPWEPIRLGEDKARIRLDLGNDATGTQLIVSRTYKATAGDAAKPYTTTLKIEYPDGSQPQKPQAILDALISGVSFDPEAFIRAKPDEQVKIVQSLVPDFDFAAKEAERKKIFATRTDANREAKRLRAQADGIKIPAGASVEKIDTAPLVEKLRGLAELRADYERRAARRQTFMADIENQVKEYDRQKAKAAALRLEADEVDKDADTTMGVIVADRATAAAWPALVEPENGADLQRQIGEAGIANVLADKVLDRKRIEYDAEIQEEIAMAFTAEMEAIDAAVLAALDGANLPAGMTIDDGRVLMKGVPFSQGSSAQKIRASVAIGLQMNPTLKVMQIHHGALLDEQAFAILAEVAEEEGLQLWVEVVRPNTKAAIIIEDGSVKNAVGKA